LTAQQPKQKHILNTKIDYNNSIMVDWMLILPSLNSKMRDFGDHTLSSHNQSVSQPVSAAKFNAAGARPTLILTNQSLWQQAAIS